MIQLWRKLFQKPTELIFREVRLSEYAQNRSFRKLFMIWHDNHAFFYSIVSYHDDVAAGLVDGSKTGLS
jgi:hypothetical protein